MTKTFRLKPEAVAKRVRRVICFLIVFYLLVVALVFWTTVELSWTTPFALIAVLGVGGHAIWRSSRRLRDAWNSYELILSDEEIARRMTPLPDVVIRREDIVKITRNRRDRIVIHGPNRSRVIAVSAALDGFAELIEILSSWRLIENRHGEK